MKRKLKLNIDGEFSLLCNDSLEDIAKMMQEGKIEWGDKCIIHWGKVKTVSVFK